MLIHTLIYSAPDDVYFRAFWPINAGQIWLFVYVRRRNDWALRTYLSDDQGQNKVRKKKLDYLTV